MENRSYVKALILPFHQKILSIQSLHFSLKCCFEKLSAWILVILIKNVSKVDVSLFHRGG